MSEEKKEEEVVEEDVNKEIEKSLKSIFKEEKEGMSKSIQTETLEKVQSLLDEHKKKMEKGVGVYNQEVQKDEKRKKLNEFLREGLKSVIGRSETEGFAKVKAEMTTDSTGTPFAGYITDSFLSAEIRHLMTTYGTAAREFNSVSFTQSSYKANNLVTDVSVFWVSEGAVIKSTQAVLGQKTLELEKLATIVGLTRELLQEQEIDFISFLGSRVAEGFAKAEDEAFFIGDGTTTYGGFTGLLNDTNLNEVAMDAGDGDFSDITVEYLRAMQDKTPSGALANAKYYMNRTILSYVRNLREDAVSAGDKAGAFIWKSPQGTEPANIDGYPVVLVEAMPKNTDTAVDTSFVLFGDLRQTTIRGTRGGIIADMFESGSIRNIGDTDDLNLITTDRKAVRWISQVGYIAILPSACTKLTTSSTSN